MTAFLLALISISWGAEPTVQVNAALPIERAKAAMARNAPEQGRDLAIKALQVDPESEMAWRVYLRASQMMGMGEVAEAEIAHAANSDAAARIAWMWWQVNLGILTANDLGVLADSDGGRIAWAWASYNATADLTALDHLPDLPNNEMVARLKIRAHAEAGNSKYAARLSRSWMRDNPKQPQTLVEIWAADPSRAIERFKKRAVAKTRVALTENPKDALLHYRSLRLFAAARIHTDSKAAVEQIGAMGLERPLYRTLWNTPMREGMGHVLGMKQDGTLPDGTDEELLDITRSWSDSLVQKERFEQAGAAWTQLTNTVQTPEALLAHAQFLQQMELSEAALVQAERGRILASEPRWNDEGDLDLAYRALLLADLYGIIAELGMEERDPKMARTAAAIAHGLDPQQRWATLRAGLNALPVDGATPVPPDVLAQSWVDSLMAPFDGGLTAERARALEQAGHVDSAFVAWSVAKNQGADVGDAVERTYPGVGDAQVASHAAVRAYNIARRNYGARLAALHKARNDQAMPTQVAPGPGFLLSEWTGEGIQGQGVGSAELAGKPYLLTFWASWCGPCLQELPQLNQAVEGTALNVVALSTDAKIGVWQRAYRKHRWTQLTHIWSPRLAATLHIEQIPTAFVVDAEGRVVNVFVGYHPNGVPEMLEALRALP